MGVIFANMARLGSLRFFVGLALFLLGTTTTPVSAGSGCGMDILGICNAAKTLAPVIDNLPDHIRAAAEAVADRLFNVDLPPAIDKMTAAAKALEDRAEHDYEEALNATSKAVYELAKKALALTEQLAANVTKDVEAVVQEVQTAISQDIDKLFTDIDNSVNKLLTRLEDDGKELFCAVESWMNTFQNTISTYFSAQDCQCVQKMLELNPGIAQDCECTSCFHIAGFYPKCSSKPLGFAFDSYHSKMKYDFLKCHQEKPIDWQTWTVDQILSQLGTLQAAALGFRCLEDMNPGSTIVRDYFSDEYTNISYTIDVWRNTGASQQLNLRQSAPVYHAAAESTNVVAQVTPIVENTHASTGADSCAGKTIQQCVTDAMAQLQQAQKALQQAQQQFATSVPPLQAAVKDLAIAINPSLQMFNLKSCPTGWREVTSSQGYVLVSRPDGVTPGAHNGQKALSANETGRVGPHSHAAQVTDNGHSHSVVDPGHSHTVRFGGGQQGNDGSITDGYPGDNGVYAADAQNAPTGITMDPSQSSITVDINSSTDPHYPLMYMLLCEKVQEGGVAVVPFRV